MDRSGYYIGIDGGATKSRLLLEFEDGQMPVCFSGGPLNICSVPEHEVAESLVKLFMQVADAVGGLRVCRGVGIGVAGFTNPQAEPFFREQINRFFPGVPTALGSDAAAALYGAHLGRNGIVLIAGTGSVCYGIREGRSCQVGGGGHLIDDEGSGYAIGRDILSAVLQAQDGRSVPTVLSDEVRQKWGIYDRSQLIRFVYSPSTGKEGIAALAPLLTPACQAGDAVALAIAEKAAGHLSRMVAATVAQLGAEEGPVAFCGSILTKEPFVHKFLCKKLDKNWRNMVYYNAKGDACAGAVLMARWAEQEARASAQ